MSDVLEILILGKNSDYNTQAVELSCRNASFDSKVTIAKLNIQDYIILAKSAGYDESQDLPFTMLRYRGDIIGTMTGNKSIDEVENYVNSRIQSFR